MGDGGDGKAMLPEARRTLAALRYAQSEEARRIAPFEATLGEIDCLADLIFTHGLNLEELCPIGLWSGLAAEPTLS
jgi:hypothetical protein